MEVYLQDGTTPSPRVSRAPRTSRTENILDARARFLARLWAKAPAAWAKLATPEWGVLCALSAFSYTKRGATAADVADALGGQLAERTVVRVAAKLEAEGLVTRTRSSRSEPFRLALAEGAVPRSGWRKVSLAELRDHPIRRTWLLWASAFGSSPESPPIAVDVVRVAELAGMAVEAVTVAAQRAGLDSVRRAPGRPRNSDNDGVRNSDNDGAPRASASGASLLNVETTPERDRRADAPESASARAASGQGKTLDPLPPEAAAILEAVGFGSYRWRDAEQRDRAGGLAVEVADSGARCPSAVVWKLLRDGLYAGLPARVEWKRLSGAGAVQRDATGRYTRRVTCPECRRVYDSPPDVTAPCPSCAPSGEAVEELAEVLVAPIPWGGGFLSPQAFAAERERQFARMRAFLAAG